MIAILHWRSARVAVTNALIETKLRNGGNIQLIGEANVHARSFDALGRSRPVPPPEAADAEK